MRRISPRTRRRALQFAPLVVVATLVGIAAGDVGGGGDRKPRSRDSLAGTVTLDGTIAMRGLLDRAARRFQRRHPNVRVTVGASGDQSAIALFCAGEVDFAAVARRLDKAERRACSSSGIRYSETVVAREPIAVVVSERNRFAKNVTPDQLRAIWRPVTPALSWPQIDPALPSLPLEPVGWRPDSAPTTLLAETLFGARDPSVRTDYEVVDEAEELTKAVASSPNAIGYMPAEDLNPGSGVRALRVLPRPLYLDVSAGAWRRPEARRFLREYLRSHRLYGKFTRP
jgi:ABC-type phosphate transport system substrate-binding protein